MTHPKPAKLSRHVRIEGIALELWLGVGSPPPAIDSVALADALGLEIKRGFPGLPAELATRLRGRLSPERDLIEVSDSLSGREFHDVVAHELGHWALTEFGVRQSEEWADELGAALMMPLRHMGSADPMDDLLAEHEHCSERLIRVRLRSLGRVSWRPTF